MTESINSAVKTARLTLNTLDDKSDIFFVYPHDETHHGLICSMSPVEIYHVWERVGAMLFEGTSDDKKTALALTMVESIATLSFNAMAKKGRGQ